MGILLKSWVWFVFLLSMTNSVYAEAKQISLEDYTRLPNQRNVQISPDGQFLSVIYTNEGVDKLVIVDRATRKPLRAFRSRGANKGIGTVHWVNNERLVYSVTEFYSWDKQVRDTGELIGVNLDGSKHEMIFGFRAGEKQTGTRIKRKQSSYGSHRIIDLLKGDDENILITFYPWKEMASYWTHNPDAIPQIYKLNVYSGRMRYMGSLPIKQAMAVTDNRGEVRFAYGVNDNNELVVSYKKDKDAEWQDFSLDSFEGQRIVPHSFTEDDNSVYLTANVGNGTRALYLFNLQDQSFEKLFHDEQVDISKFIKNFSGRRIVAVGTEILLPEYQYLDDDDKKAKLHQMLMESFKGFDVDITSATQDERYVIVYAYSDTNPGDYYLFDTEKLKADFILTSRPWINIRQTRPTQSMSFTTRDGQQINGYVTLPKESNKNLPLVVLPHGGPHGVRDEWGFDWEAQLLASRGYAVLQVNYRGSGGFGRAFQAAGYGKWGTLMQDDITDATNIMIEKGIADKSRICIFGASYGGYAALMGSVREPELYKCAIGSVGVYDLPMMFEEGDIADSNSGLAYLKKVLGNDLADQKRRSPAYNVDKIKADLLLIHGARDERAPIEQAESLMSALDKIDKLYEWLELSNEGHGYYDEKNRVKVYSKVLEFLDKNIGNKLVHQAKK